MKIFMAMKSSYKNATFHRFQRGVFRQIGEKITGPMSYVLSGVERTGPLDGGPARVARRGRVGARGREGAVRTGRRGGSAIRPVRILPGLATAGSS